MPGPTVHTVARLADAAVPNVMSVCTDSMAMSTTVPNASIPNMVNTNTSVITSVCSGYVVKGELISLRGTLVPATTLNKVIGSIPILGNILIGKKSGEGVFGVSFKMKGPPKALKTTVNPIKTLTPRFIVRVVEKMKKLKKKKAK